MKVKQYNIIYHEGSQDIKVGKHIKSHCIDTMVTLKAFVFTVYSQGLVAVRVCFDVASSPAAST